MAEKNSLEYIHEPLYQFKIGCILIEKLITTVITNYCLNC
jgi:hypothetical protein